MVAVVGGGDHQIVITISVDIGNLSGLTVLCQHMLDGWCSGGIGNNVGMGMLVVAMTVGN